ncbi:MAG: hypothetical protein AAGA17_12355 [Actinomycetota bacterium]
MRRCALPVLVLVLAVACGGDDLTDAEERAFAAAPTAEQLPAGWALDEAGPTGPGDAPDVAEGCEQLRSLDVSDGEGFVTVLFDAPDIELPLFDVSLDLIVVEEPADALAYVSAVADPDTPTCLVGLDDELVGVAVIDVDPPTAQGVASARLRFDFPENPDEEEAPATLELVALADGDLLAVVELAYATQVPPPALDELLAVIAERVAAAP